MTHIFCFSSPAFRPLRMAATAALTLSFTSPGSSEVIDKVCIINGLQGVGTDTGSTAIGTGRFRIDTTLNTLAYSIDISGIPETAAHIHGPAAPEVAADVIHPLPLGDSKAGIWDYPDDLEAAILAGQTYVNIHSDAFPSGEIRGQVTNKVSTLHGAQENMPNNATGRGLAFYSVDALTNTLGYYASYTVEGTETAAHIHGFSPRGVVSAVKHPLTVGSPKKGIWNYADSDEGGLFTGLTYMNVHTAPNYPAGEIRGQIEFRVPGPTATSLWQLYD